MKIKYGLADLWAPGLDHMTAPKDIHVLRQRKKSILGD